MYPLFLLLMGVSIIATSCGLEIDYTYTFELIFKFSEIIRQTNLI